MVQYCGRGVPVGRQYYHAWKRSEETPLEYLYRLNVAGLRAKIPVKDGTQSVRREHVEHFIHTLDDRDLVRQLTMLRLSDADELEDTLRALQRSENQQRKASMGPNKFRQRSAAVSAPAASKPTRAVSAVYVDNNCNGSDSDQSDSDAEPDRHPIFSAIASDRVKIPSDSQPDQADVISPIALIGTKK